MRNLKRRIREEEYTRQKTERKKERIIDTISTIGSISFLLPIVATILDKMFKGELTDILSGKISVSNKNG